MYASRLSCLPDTTFEDMQSVYLQNKENIKVTEQVMLSVGELDMVESGKNIEFWISFLTGDSSKMAITLLRNKFSQLLPE